MNVSFRWLICLQSHLFSIYSFQRFSALLSDSVARLALVLQCDSSGTAPGIWSFLEPYSELYCCWNNYLHQLVLHTQKPFFRWERITKLECSGQICSFPFSLLFFIVGFFCMCAKHVLGQVLYLSLDFSFFLSIMLYVSVGLMIIFHFWKWMGEACLLRADFPIMSSGKKKNKTCLVWQ